MPMFSYGGNDEAEVSTVVLIPDKRFKKTCDVLAALKQHVGIRPFEVHSVVIEPPSKRYDER